MCGRYSLATPDPGQLRDRFPIGESLAVRRRYNIAPGDEVPAVTLDRCQAPRGELLRWGLVPPWSKHPASAVKMINARRETLRERPAYRDAFRRWRCLILADGFYEWQALPDGRKQAYWITRHDGLPFAFAGLWSRWRSPQGAQIRSCTIITTAANEAIAPLHDRMPVILQPPEEAVWLSEESDLAQLERLLTGLPAPDTRLRAVGPAVGDARYDGPECLAPPPAAQATLF